jgi:heterotetrameric sarcosine oxidase gamma subunit
MILKERDCMIDHSGSPGGTLFSAPGLTIDAAPVDHWLQAGSRAHPSQLKAFLATALGVEPNERVNTVTRVPGGPEILAVGPGRWLLRYPPGRTLDSPAPQSSVTDISDSMLGFRVSGDGARELLGTGCPLELGDWDDTRPGCAHSLFHHIPLLIHRLQNNTLDLLVPRSYLAEFQHALLHSARALAALQSNTENG